MWKNIDGYSGVYQVSNMGNVRRLLDDGGVKILHPTLRKDKYMIVGLQRHNRYVNKYVHRLVLETFVGNQPSIEYETRHLDGNPQNNKLNNLRWGTRSENVLDSIEHGTRFQPDVRGSRNGASKLTEFNVRKIKHLINQHIPPMQIAKQFNISVDLIYSIKAGRVWKHV